MAKQKKRREADFTTKEMADLSNCKSEQTFMNRLNSVCEHYGIDPMLFNMDETINSSENFFPAECGELLALLVKYYKDNPAVNENKDLKGVTAQNICTFYKEMMEDIDKLPDEIKNICNEDNIIVVRPKTIFDKNDTLRFEKEFCKQIYYEGYEIGKNLNISM